MFDPFPSSFFRTLLLSFHLCPFPDFSSCFPKYNGNPSPEVEKSGKFFCFGFVVQFDFLVITFVCPAPPEVGERDFSLLAIEWGKVTTPTGLTSLLTPRTYTKRDVDRRSRIQGVIEVCERVCWGGETLSSTRAHTCVCMSVCFLSGGSFIWDGDRVVNLLI